MDQQKPVRHYMIDEASITNLVNFARKQVWEVGDPIIQWVSKAFTEIPVNIAQEVIKVTTPQPEPTRTGEGISN